MKQFKTLYARNSNGKINQWSIRVEDYPNQRYSRTYINEGLIDGTKTETIRNTLNGKNVGKMNATTPYEQACFEAESRWEKKKKQGYKSMKDLGLGEELIKLETQEHSNEYLVGVINAALAMSRTDANDISKPMKAQQYYKFKTVDGVKTKTNEPLIKFPCYGQPKLNGFRVMARWEKVEEGEGMFKTEVEKVVFRSKEGLRYDILEHIADELSESWFKIWIGKGDNSKQIDIALDGEMYIHREILSEIASAVRKRNPKTPLLKFHIFDAACEETKQSERINIINNLRESFRARGVQNSIIVDTDEIHGNKEAQDFTDNAIKEGYEGAIFRDMKALYAFGKRPQTMVKLKRSEDKEFKIVDVKGGDNSPDLAVFVCIQEEGLTFDCTPEGSQEVKREYLSNKDKYIGKMLTIRFFERTKDNKPFHAVGTVIRDYE